MRVEFGVTAERTGVVSPTVLNLMAQGAIRVQHLDLEIDNRGLGVQARVRVRVRVIVVTRIIDRGWGYRLHMRGHTPGPASH